MLKKKDYNLYKKRSNFVDSVIPILASMQFPRVKYLGLPKLEGVSYCFYPTESSPNLKKPGFVGACKPNLSQLISKVQT